MNQDIIFTPLSFRSLTIKNRVLRSSMSGRFDNYDGSGSYARINWEEKFARGGVGAIISAFVPVSLQGSHMPNFAVMDADDKIPFWREVGRRVHEYDCKFIMQLNHCGRQQDMRGVLNWERKALGAGSKPDPLNGFPVTMMTHAQVQEVIQQFIDAARRAREAGLDGVELHGANGYLINQFLSSAINDRVDEYGGPLRNRARFLLQIISGIREQVGEDWHLQVKLNALDMNNALLPWLPEGNTLDDAIQVARWAEEEGVDSIHVSSGSAFPHPNNPPGDLPVEALQRTIDTIISEGSRTLQTYLALRFPPTREGLKFLWNRARSEIAEGINAGYSREIKKAVSVPVLCTGGFQQAHVIRMVLEDGACDAVAIARPLIANNDLVQIYAAGKNLPERPCTYCNKCLGLAAENPLGCYELDRYDGDYEAMMADVMSVYQPAPW
ncbi:MAG: NADH:flavin oxidoreductase [Candidatus Promineifilaceae bacterium]